MNTTDIQLIINKEIKAPIAKVYQAWTDPEMIKKWFVPSNEMTVAEVNVDLQAGGNYLIHMHHPKELTDHIVEGKYEQIIPNEKLVFNWKWRDGVDRSQVTIEFQSKSENLTQISLTHIGFSQQEYANKHQQGWDGCLKNLTRHLAG